MTRAVVATAFGGPEVLAVIQTPAGSPGPGEALVSVRAAGTNPIDYKLYSGAMGQDPARLPMRLGFEAAGVVTEVADGAEGPGGRGPGGRRGGRDTGCNERVRVPTDGDERPSVQRDAPSA